MRIKKKNLLFEERVKKNIPIPKEVKRLHKLFVNNGFKLYLVGGAVRDNLMGKPIKDYDLATDANPTKVEEILNSNKVKNIGTGKQFGVINAFVNGEEFEIATFRVDSKESDGTLDSFLNFIKQRVSSVKYEEFKNKVKPR